MLEALAKNLALGSLLDDLRQHHGGYDILGPHAPLVRGWEMKPSGKGCARR